MVYARLKSNWALRGWNNQQRAVVNVSSGAQRLLTTKEFYVARSCDGNNNFDSLSYLPEHKAILKVLLENNIAELCKAGDSIEGWQRFRQADNPRLSGIHWCVTGLCNLNCRHCCIQAPSRKYRQLPFDQMVSIVEQFEHSNVPRVSLSGGEPFFRTDISQLLALLAHKRIGISQIYTNGLLITDEHLQNIRRLGFFPKFQISFDGVGAHDRMRGFKGIEERTVESIKKVRTEGFPVVVSTSIDRMSLTRLEATYDLMKDMAINLWRVSSPQGVGNWRYSKTVPTMEEEAQVYERLLVRWISDNKPFGLQLGGFFHSGLKRDSQRNKRSAFDCSLCRVQPCLLPDGTLIPCPAYTDTRITAQMPNLIREDLTMVWRNSRLRDIIDLKKQDILAKNPECERCEHYSECGMGCRAAALTETNDLLAKDPLTCKLYKHGFKTRFNELEAL